MTASRADDRHNHDAPIRRACGVQSNCAPHHGALRATNQHTHDAPQPSRPSIAHLLRSEAHFDDDWSRLPPPDPLRPTFRVVQWNMRGWSSYCASTCRRKQLSRDTIVHDVQPEAIVLQELRVHYFPRKEDPNAFAGFDAPTLTNYNAVAQDVYLRAVLILSDMILSDNYQIISTSYIFSQHTKWRLSN